MGVRRRRFLLVVAITASGICRASDGAGGTDGLAKRQEYLRSGMFDGRARLVSGVYRASGRKLDESPGNLKIDGEYSILSAFDPEGRVRFDRTWPRRVRREGPNKSMTPAVVESRTVKSIIADGRTVVHEGGNLAANVFDPAHAPRDLAVFDVRGIGLYFPISLDRGNKFATVADSWLGRPASEIVEEPGRIHRIVWDGEKTSQEIQVRRTLWIDEARGFTPIRYRVQVRNCRVETTTWDYGEVYCQAAWVENSGVWVPKTVSLGERNGIGDKASRDRLDLAFEWESINEPIPSAYFDVEGFAMEPARLVIDQRLPKSVVAGTIGKDHRLIPGGSRDRILPPVKSDAWPLWMKILSVNIVIIGLLLSSSAIRARRRRSPAS